MPIRKVVYVNIDDWNRPVFKALDGNQYYGATDILFPYEESEASVLKKVTTADLTFFGGKFNCEPLGATSNWKLQIVKRGEMT